MLFRSYVWNLQTSLDGENIAVNVKSGGKYDIAVNDKIWEGNFSEARDFALSPDGKNIAACIQKEPLPAGDIFKFLEGVWTIAVNGELWNRNFLNVWGVIFSPDNRNVAAEVRTGNSDYTIAVDGNPWNKIFKYVWEPLFNPSGDVIAPVQTEQGWNLALNGELIWNKPFNQLWQQRYSPDFQR